MVAHLLRNLFSLFVLSLHSITYLFLLPSYFCYLLHLSLFFIPSSLLFFTRSSSPVLSPSLFLYICLSLPIPSSFSHLLSLHCLSFFANFLLFSLPSHVFCPSLYTCQSIPIYPSISNSVSIYLYLCNIYTHIYIDITRTHT